jgi:hypothetical protein
MRYMLEKRGNTTSKREFTPLSRSSRFSPKCVQISRDGENKRDGAGGVRTSNECQLERSPKTARQSLHAIERDCDFCDFDPPEAGGRGSCKTGPGWFIPL